MDLALQAMATFGFPDLFGNRAFGPMARPDLTASAASIPPLSDWSLWGTSDNSEYTLSYGSYYVSNPIHGKGLTVHPHNPATFRFQLLGNGFVSIATNGKYVFAGDQATVKTGKDKVGEWEQFIIRTTNVRAGDQTVTLCTIECKRDREFWYIDEEGMLRHRNRCEKGVMCQVFTLRRV